MINRIVVLKTLTAGLAKDPKLLKGFSSEARSTGGLQHPDIVIIYEVGQEGSTPFIAMEFLNVESLDKIIPRRSSLSLLQTIGFIACVCRGLGDAHRRRRPVIHRDIEPGNLLVWLEFLPAHAAELDHVECLWSQWKQTEPPNFCPQTFWQLSHYASQALRRKHRRTTPVTGSSAQAERF